MDRARHLLQSTLIVIAFLGLGKLTGFIRIILVSNVYGTGREADAFTAANQLPEVFFVLIAGGALAAAFIPVYSLFLSGQLNAAARLVNSTLTLVLLLLGGLAGLSALLAPALARHVLVPNYDPALQALTARLMQIILIQTVLFGVSGVLSSILNARQHFALPALAPVALDIGYVVGLYGLAPRLGIAGLAWGTVLGGLLHIAIQVPALVRHRITYRPDWELARFGLREIGRQIGGLWQRRRRPAFDRTVHGGLSEIIYLMGPRIVMLGAIQAADIFVLRLGSGLGQGAVAGYFYAFTLMQLPETLLGTAIGIVAFPTMAEYYNAGRIDALKQLTVTALRIIWVLTIPAAVALVLVGRPAITVILERGAFDPDSTALVYGALAVFSLRIVSEASLEIVARLFYARHNTRTPMLAYLGWFVVNVGLMLVLVGSRGIQGLALASTVAFTLLAAALYGLNRRDLGALGGRQLALSAGRSLLASGAMALVIVAARPLAPEPLPFLALAVSGGLVVYFLVHFLLGGREIPQLLQLVRARRAPARP